MSWNDPDQKKHPRFGFFSGTPQNPDSLSFPKTHAWKARIATPTPSQMWKHEINAPLKVVKVLDMMLEGVPGPG